MTYGMRPIASVFALLFGIVPATLLFSFPAYAEPSAPAIPHIAIGEVAWAGSSRSTADEWIELWNFGPEPVDLSGWTIEGAAGSTPLSLPSGSKIAPRSVFVVANYDSDDAHSTLAIPPSLVTTAISLPNTNLRLVLKDANGTAVDQTPDGNAPAAGSSKDPKRSMVRTLDGNWTDGTTAAGFDPGVTDLGTPGICDRCVEAESSAAPAPATMPSPAPETTASEILPSPAGSPAEAPAGPNPVMPPTENGTTAPSIPPCQPPHPIPAPAAESAAPFPPTEIPASTGASPTPPIPAPATTTDAAADPPVDSTSTMESGSSTQNVSTPSTTAILAPTPASEPPAESPAAASASTSSASTVSATSSTTTLVSASIASENLATASIACNRLRIQEVHPNPSSGHEWIELVSIDNADIRIDGCILRDAAGIIATIPMDTILAPDAIHVVTLASNKLNNSGDSVSVGTADAVGDRTAFGTAPQGISWGLVPGTGSWEWMEPTPGLANPMRAANDPQPEPITPPTTDVAQTTAPTILTLTAVTSSTSTSTTSSRVPPVTKPTAAKTTAAAKSNTVQAPKETAAKTAATKPPAEAKVKTTTVKTTKLTTATKTTPIHPLDPWPESFSAFMDLNPGIIVRLRGRVATPPRLISAHAFILTAPDGKGLSVSVPNNQRLPEFGASVEVTGTLSFDAHDIPRLSIKSGQTIHTLPGAPTPETPRMVEFLAPGLEDAWAFVSASGTVLEAKGTRIRLETDGVEISVLVKASVGYRAARLNPGDLVAVRGILDIGKDDPEIIARVPADIILVAPAPKPIASAQAPKPKTFPGWTPLGTAVGAIGAIEGVKSASSWRRRRKIVSAKHGAYANPPTIQPTMTPKEIAAPPTAAMRNP